jgi:hypothetical protein
VQDYGGWTAPVGSKYLLAYVSVTRISQGDLLTSAIMGAQVAVAGSLPQGNSSVLSSGLSATGSRSSSIPAFGSGITGPSTSSPVIMVMPSRSRALLVVGTRSWKSKGF